MSQFKIISRESKIQRTALVVPKAGLEPART